jgi:hypothetical protein
MTAIIRSTIPQRRRLIGRGKLSESDALLPPAAVFTGEQADLQMQEVIDSEAQVVDEEYDDSELEEITKKPAESVQTVIKPPVKKVSRVRIITKDDEEGEDEDVGENTPPSEPVPAKQLKAKKVGFNPIEDIMNAMRSGEAVMIKREGTNSYQVSVVPNDIIVSKTGFKYLKKGITGKQYWNEVLNPEFEVWSKKWNSMTYTEKLAYATKLGVTWRRSETNERLDVMNMSEAVRKAENIDKYKPEYKKRSARAKVRG